MKKFSLIIISLIVATITVQAQTVEQEIEIFQEVFGKGKKIIVAEFIQPSSEVSDKFWEVYESYETERVALGEERISILMDYADNYENMSEDKMSELLKRAQTHHKKFGALLTKYQKKIQKVSSVKASAQFYQLENYFESVIRLSIMESIPFIGELDN